MDSEEQYFYTQGMFCWEEKKKKVEGKNEVENNRSKKCRK